MTLPTASLQCRIYFDNDGLTALQEFEVWNRPENSNHACGNPPGKRSVEFVAKPAGMHGGADWPVTINNHGELLIQRLGGMKRPVPTR